MTKRKQKLIVGFTYFGPLNRRLTVLEVKENNVLVQHPLSHAQETISLAEMQAFVIGSPLRTYRHKDGEVRTKTLESADEVFYSTLDHQFLSVPREEWLAWRKDA